MINVLFALIVFLSSSGIAAAQRVIQADQIQLNYETSNPLTLSAATAASPFALVLPSTQGASGQCMVWTMAPATSRGLRPSPRQRRYRPLLL